MANKLFFVIGDGSPARQITDYINCLDNCEVITWYTSDQLPQLQEAVKHHVYDWLISINNTAIIDAYTLSTAEGGCLNAHPAPLPEWAGLYMHHFAIDYGDVEEWGATIHLMEEEVDAGALVLWVNWPISKNDTPATLYLRATKECIKMMKHIIYWIANAKGWQHLAVPQDLSRRTVYTRAMARNNGWIE
ncbi:MAG: formyltransferase family protein [Planctomycetota bacterium]|jgi:folate-dependent phosphoribosylglycinamide formyltransferase PurN